MTENNFHADLVAALGEMQNPPMTADNPHFRSKFSSLIDCVNTIRPILSKHSIAVTQMVQSNEGGDRLVTRLVHKSGEYIEDGGLPLVNTNDPQKMGSSLTYARRYGLLSITGAVGESDDDGNKASEPELVAKQQVKRETKAAFKVSDFVLHYLDGRSLPFDSSKGWVDAYSLEMRKLMKDAELTEEEKRLCMEELEEKNAETLAAIVPGAAKELKEKRQQANKMLEELK
jgi:hypothetical protein